jgi:hypothetical protein
MPVDNTMLDEKPIEVKAEIIEETPQENIYKGTPFEDKAVNS